MLFGVLLSSCGIVHQSKQIERFTQSKFTVNSMVLESIMGRDVSHVKKASDLNFNDMIEFTAGFYNGNLMAQMLFNIEVNNPSDQEAAISGMDWKLLQKDQVVASGQMNKPVEVAPHGKTSFDLEAEVNLSKILQLNSVDQIFSVLSGKMSPQIIKKLGLVIKLKPYYKLNGKVQKFPGYLTINPDLGN